MLRRLRYLTQKIKHAFKKRSLQFTISITFTLVAVTGMILVAVILSARFVNSNEQMISDDNRRMLNQVNLNLDNYLHNMMRVSDSMYYRVIKNVDIDTDMESLTKDMGLLYETNRDLLVSVAVFTDNGEVVAAEPLSPAEGDGGPKEPKLVCGRKRTDRKFAFFHPACAEFVYKFRQPLQLGGVPQPFH